MRSWYVNWANKIKNQGRKLLLDAPTPYGMPMGNNMKPDPHFTKKFNYTNWYQVNFHYHKKMQCNYLYNYIIC